MHLRVTESSPNPEEDPVLILDALVLIIREDGLSLVKHQWLVKNFLLPAVKLVDNFGMLKITRTL